MTKKILIPILFFYLLSLFEASFLIHFEKLSRVPSLILILTILLNFLEKPEKNSGIFSAFVGGFFWDIFSSRFIGFHILILLTLAIFIKLILRKYVRPVIRLGNRLQKT